MRNPKPTDLLGDGSWLGPEDDENKDQTTKAKRVAGGVELETVSPIGQAVGTYVAAEHLGEHHDTSHHLPSAERIEEQKPPEPPQPQNPKRTRNSQNTPEPDE